MQRTSWSVGSIVRRCAAPRSKKPLSTACRATAGRAMRQLAHACHAPPTASSGRLSASERSSSSSSASIQRFSSSVGCFFLHTQTPA